MTPTSPNKTAQATPGPWIWKDGYEGLYAGSIAQENAVMDFAMYEGMWLSYRDERDANANLIAAAPELLAALKQAVEVMESVAKTHSYDISIGAVPDARAAIQKAEGRSA